MALSIEAHVHCSIDAPFALVATNNIRLQWPTSYLNTYPSCATLWHPTTRTVDPNINVKSIKTKLKSCTWMSITTQHVFAIGSCLTRRTTICSLGDSLSVYHSTQKTNSYQDKKWVSFFALKHQVVPYKQTLWPNCIVDPPWSWLGTHVVVFHCPWSILPSSHCSSFFMSHDTQSVLDV